MPTSIPRERLLRRLEQLSHASTALAFAVTIVLVTTGLATELNLVAQTLFAEAGWALTGLLALGVITASFAYYERHVDEHPRLMLGAAGLLTLLAIADLGVNLYILAKAGVPDYVHWDVYALPAVTVLVGGLVAMARRPFRSLAAQMGAPSLSVQQTAAVAFALLLVVSGVGPFASFGGIVPQDHDGTASAAVDLTVEDTSNSTVSSPYGFAETDDYIFVSDGSDNTVVKLRKSDLAQVGEYTGHSDNVNTEALAVGPNGYLYSGSWNGVHKIDPSDMSQVDTYTSIPWGSSIEFHNGYMFIGDGSNADIHKVDPTDMTTVESVTAIESNGVTSITFFNGNLYAAGSSTGVVYQLNKTDLSVADSTTFDSGSNGADSLEAGEDSLYVLNREDGVFKLDGSLTVQESTSNPDLDTDNYLEFSPDGYLYQPHADGGFVQMDPSNLSILDSYTGINEQGLYNQKGTKYLLYGEDDGSGNYTITRADPGTTISQPPTGQALDQNGDPVANATVAVSYEGKNISEVTLNNEPYQELQNDPTKNLDSWQSQMDNLSVEDPSEAGVSTWHDYLDEKNDARVVSHTGDDWAKEGRSVNWIVPDPTYETTRELPGVTLREPTVVYDADETVMLSVWEGTGSLIGPQDALDIQLPGETTPGTIEVSRIDPLGDTMWTETYQTDPIYNNRAPGNYGWSDDTGALVKNHHAAAMDLDPGMYRASPANSSLTTVFVVSETGELDGFEAEIRNWAGDTNESISEYNQRARDKVSNLPVETTTTNETGYYTLNPPAGAESADITVTKTGAKVNVDDPINASKPEIQGEIETVTEANFNDEVPSIDFDAAHDARNTDDTFQRACQDMDSVANDIGSPYYGDKRDVPVSGGDFDVQGDRILTNGLDPAAQQCTAINFAEQIAENGLGSVFAGLPDDLSELTDAELEDLVEPWLALFNANPTLKDEVEERTGVTLDSDDPTEYTREDLEALGDDGVSLVDDGTSTIPTGGNTGGGGIPTGGDGDPPNIGDGNGTVDDAAETLSQEWPVANVDDWDQAALVIRITNGQGETVATLSQDSEYVTVDEGPGADTVTLNEYPIDGEAKAFAVQIDVITPDGAGDNHAPPVAGPGLNGQIPATEHIRVSTLSPAAGDSVTISAGGGPSFGSVEHVNVTQPDGTTTQYTATDGEATIDTGSAGDHRVAVAMSNAEGEVITEVLTVKAGTTAQSRPATIIADSGVTGRFAVVGNGFQSGSIETADGNSEVKFVGVYSDEPGPVSVHATGISAASDTRYSVELRKGADERAIDSSPEVLLHMPTTDSEAIYWRNGRALPKGEQNSEGTVTHRNESSVAETYYDAEAGLEVRAVEDPGIIQSTRHWIDRNIPSTPFSVFGAGAVGLAVLPAGAVVGRRYL